MDFFLVFFFVVLEPEPKRAVVELDEPHRLSDFFFLPVFFFAELPPKIESIELEPPNILELFFFLCFGVKSESRLFEDNPNGVDSRRSTTYLSPNLLCFFF